MQASFAGPLASYNSLTDEHLAEYFSNPRTFKHLRRMGLVTRDGRIVEEGILRVNNARKEQKARSKGVLANSIVNKAIEIERKRRSDLKRKLELLEKYDIVEKVKSQKRHPLGIQEFNPYRTVPPPPPRLSTTLDMHFDQLSLSLDQASHMRHLVGRISRDRSIPQRRAKSPYEEELSSRYSTPVPRPPSTPRPSTSASVGGRRSTIINRPSTAPARMGPRRSTLRSITTRSQPMHSNVSITLKFIGTGLHLESERMKHKQSEVMVVQQHCGGNTVTLYSGRLRPKGMQPSLVLIDLFTFVSKRHIGMPYGLTIYLDGMMDSRVSACCEYRHQCGRLLGSKTAHFKLVKVEGGKPCYRCEVELKKKHLKEGEDQEIDRVLGDTLSVQELTTPQSSASVNDEPPSSYNSPFHSGSETSQEDTEDHSPIHDTFKHEKSSEPEDIPEVEDKTSLANHSRPSLVSRESLKSLSSRVSVASSKSSTHSQASSLSKASSHSSKSSRPSSSKASSRHSLTDQREGTELEASKVSLNESVRDSEKQLSDGEREEVAEVEEEYMDDKFEESEEVSAREPKYSSVEEQTEGNSDAVVQSTNREGSLSDEEYENTRVKNEGDEVDKEEDIKDEDKPEIEDISWEQSENEPEPAVDERPPSPLSKESSAGEKESSVSLAADRDSKDKTIVNSESVSDGSRTDVDDNQSKPPSDNTPSDRSSVVEDQSQSQQESDDASAADIAEVDSRSVACTEAEDDDKSAQRTDEESSLTKEAQASLEVPENDGLPPHDGVEEKEMEASNSTEEAAKEQTSQHGILLTSSKCLKPARSVSFEDNLDDRSSKDLSPSLALDEAKVPQKSQSNISLSSQSNSEVASSVGLNATDGTDTMIPDLEQKISDLIEDEDKTKSHEREDSLISGDSKDASEGGTNSELANQNQGTTNESNDIHSSRTDIQETQELNTLADDATDQDGEADTGTDHQKEDAEPNGPVESGLSSSSSKSSLTSVSSQESNG